MYSDYLDNGFAKFIENGAMVSNVLANVIIILLIIIRTKQSTVEYALLLNYCIIDTLLHIFGKIFEPWYMNLFSYFPEEEEYEVGSTLSLACFVGTMLLLLVLILKTYCKFIEQAPVLTICLIWISTGIIFLTLYLCQYPHYFVPLISMFLLSLFLLIQHCSTDLKPIRENDVRYRLKLFIVLTFIIFNSLLILIAYPLDVNINFIKENRFTGMPASFFMFVILIWHRGWVIFFVMFFTDITFRHSAFTFLRKYDPPRVILTNY